MGAIDPSASQESIVLGLNLSPIDLTHLEDAWNPKDSVSDAIETAHDETIDAGLVMRELTAGIVRGPAHGDSGEPCASAERGVDHALQSCARFDYGVLCGRPAYNAHRRRRVRAAR
jgi:hypothetical protein